MIPQAHPDAPVKPAYGAPCNGCGLCCMAQQCPVSTMLLGEHDLCPALTPMGNVYVCGLVADTKRFFHPSGSDKIDDGINGAIRYLLGAGKGCDALLQGETRPDAATEARLRGDLEIGRKAIDLLVHSVRWLRQWPGKDSAPGAKETVK